MEPEFTLEAEEAVCEIFDASCEFGEAIADNNTQLQHPVFESDQNGQLMLIFVPVYDLLTDL